MDHADDRGLSFAADYLDEVVLRIAFVEAPDAVADEVWEVAFAAPNGAWSERPVVLALEELLLEAPGGPYEYGLQTRRSVHSWGADAAVLVVAGYVTLRAVDALIGMAVQGGVRGLLRRFAPPTEREQPSREAMLASAQWRVASAFDVDYDGLRLIAEERRSGEGVSQFEFRDAVNVYVVEMGAVDGIPLSSRVRRATIG